MAIQRASKHAPCPVCGGHPDMPRGKGQRCTGFTTDEGYIHCTREEFAGRCKRHEGGVEPTWSHRAEGPCPCGQTHGAAPYEPPPPRPARAPERKAEVRELGEAKRAEMVATYDYRDIKGRLLYQVCRFNPKTFRQRRPDGNGGWIWNLQGITPTLYRIPDLVPALRAGDTIWICEGEKDVEAIFEAGGVATCNTMGAGKWRDNLSEAFAKFGEPGGEVRIIQDRDPELKADGKPHREGQRHARAVYESIVAATEDVNQLKVSIWEAAEGKDAADHLAAGKTLGQFIQVYPFPDNLLQTDPARFKQNAIRQALDAPPKTLEYISRDHLPEQQPLCPTGLIGSNKLRHIQGVTVLSGDPSAGKSFFAISTAVAAANAGWEVFYLSCEMHEDLVFSRTARAVAGAALSGWEWRDIRLKQEAILRARTLKIPENLAVVNVDAGVTIDDVVEMLALAVSDRHTLVILDSLSSFVDNLKEEASGDPFKMASLRRVVRLATATRRLTHGHVAWLLLSELNKEGKAKGRFIEHRSDIGLAMRSNAEQSHMKEIAITKSWWGPTGQLGEFVLEYDLAHLRKPEPDAPVQTTYIADEDLETPGM